MSLAIPTPDENYAIAKAEMVARNPLITDWEPGSNADAMVGSAVILADQSIRISVDRAKAGYVATAVGDDLDTVVLDRYPELTRIEAAGSRVTLTFTRGTTTGGIGIPEGTTCTATIDGTVYTFATDDAATMDSGDSTVDAAATCTTTGPAGRLAEDTITTITGSIPDDTEDDLTVTNVARAVGGTDEETDDAYRARAMIYPTTLGLGTVTALKRAALAVPGLAYATVDESAVEDGGNVVVYVADSDGRGNDALAADATTAIDAVRAAGILVTVTYAVREEVDLSLVLQVATGKISDALAAAVRGAVLAYTNTLPPNAALYLSAAVSAALGASTDLRGGTATSTAASGDTVEPPDLFSAIRVPSADLTIAFEEV